MRLEEIKLRVYITDALQIMGSNTARFVGGGEMSKRYMDLAYDFDNETRTEEEIKSHIKDKLNALNGGD